MKKEVHSYQDVAEWVKELLECSKDNMSLDEIANELQTIKDLEDVANGYKTHNEMCIDARGTIEDYKKLMDCEVK